MCGRTQLAVNEMLVELCIKSKMNGSKTDFNCYMYMYVPHQENGVIFLGAVSSTFWTHLSQDKFDLHKKCLFLCVVHLLFSV